MYRAPWLRSEQCLARSVRRLFSFTVTYTELTLSGDLMINNLSSP